MYTMYNVCILYIYISYMLQNLTWNPTIALAIFQTKLFGSLLEVLQCQLSGCSNQQDRQSSTPQSQQHRHFLRGRRPVGTLGDLWRWKASVPASLDAFAHGGFIDIPG